MRITHPILRGLSRSGFILCALTVAFATEAWAETYPCPPVPPADSDFWKPMSYSLEAKGKSHNLIAKGQIQRGEARRLKDKLASAMRMSGGINEVLLHSPGGDSVEGESMGRLLRELGIPTRISAGSFCVSACSVAFLGGVFRTIEAGGTYSVHMFSNFANLNENAQLKNSVNALKKMEQESAKYAADRYQYLLEMGISPEVAKHGFTIESKDISCPPLPILKRWNVDNS
jgi:hypothetical protein